MGKRSNNHRTHRIDFIHDLVVPKTQHTQASVFQHFGPMSIAFAIGVLTAVDFDDEPMLKANEI